MPNYCSNAIHLSHADPSRAQEFLNAFRQGMVCQHYIPQPEKLFLEIESMGFDATLKWEWRNKYWGTRWDIGKGNVSGGHALQLDGKIFARFDTAWSPPCLLYQHLRGLGYCIQATYLEPINLFWGTWADGRDSEYQAKEPSEVPVDVLEILGMENIFDDDETEDAM